MNSVYLIAHMEYRRSGVLYTHTLPISLRSSLFLGGAAQVLRSASDSMVHFILDSSGNSNSNADLKLKSVSFSFSGKPTPFWEVYDLCDPSAKDTLIKEWLVYV